MDDLVLWMRTGDGWEVRAGHCVVTDATAGSMSRDALEGALAGLIERTVTAVPAARLLPPGAWAFAVSEAVAAALSGSGVVQRLAAPGGGDVLCFRDVPFYVGAARSMLKAAARVKRRFEHRITVFAMKAPQNGAEGDRCQSELRRCLDAMGSGGWDLFDLAETVTEHEYIYRAIWKRAYDG